MTEMDIESTACGRNEIGPQDRYFLPDPGFTPGHDRDAYRVTQVRAPIFLSRNEDFQLFSPFFTFFHLKIISGRLYFDGGRRGVAQLIATYRSLSQRIFFRTCRRP